MYTVYGSAKTRASRVIWMLEELEVPYVIEDVFPGTPEALTASETGKIPALKDGDQMIFDSAAILMHLADKHGGLTFPVGTPERTRLQSVLNFVTDDMEQPLWTAAKHSFVLPEELRALEAVMPALHFEWTKALKTLGRLLGDGPFLMGAKFTVADIIAGHLGGWAKAMDFPAPEPLVADYIARVRARDGWQKVDAMRKAA
ncbi:MAG: glutathione S-transferase family protein [Pseudomonadota bacterium]